jgi:hypothetical protein
MTFHIDQKPLNEPSTVRLSSKLNSNNLKKEVSKKNLKSKKIRRNTRNLLLF